MIYKFIILYSFLKFDFIYFRPLLKSNMRQTNVIGGIGTQADIKSGVDISKVHRGYFGNIQNVQKFYEIGILPIIDLFSKNLKYVDFGGGKGFLTNHIKIRLIQYGLNPHSIVFDANENFLNESKNLGLETKFGNLHDKILIENVELATMRAVLHYNGKETQKQILKNIYQTLNNKGILINQASSGTKINGLLRSNIVNTKELGRNPGNYSWLSIEEIMDLTFDVGFKDVKLAGYAPSCSWSPEEQWDRFHSKRTLEATSKVQLDKINEEKKEFLDKAYSLIEEFNSNYGTKETGVIFDEKGIGHIHYQYPIIVGRK